MNRFLARLSLQKLEGKLVPICLAVSCLALVLGIYNTYLLSTTGSLPGRGLAPSQAVRKMSEKEINNLIKSGASLMGDPAAKVTVVEFADFQCPYCGKYFQNVLPRIKKDFIDKGLVKFVHVDYAFLGEESLSAAMAAHCAKDQGRFWQYHDYLYENQQGENRGAFSVENLKRFATALGLNQAQFNQCLESKKYEPVIKQETALGQDFGVKGTPATFIDDFFIPGLQDVSYFVNRIETTLKAN